jgi:hypothetical protein
MTRLAPPFPQNVPVKEALKSRIVKVSVRAKLHQPSVPNTMVPPWS